MHILAVDDNITIRQLITLTLKNTPDMRVTATEKGEEAIQLARTTPFDLILIDWLMHPMDGEALLKAIRQLPLHENTPIIILSADSNQSEKQKAKALGANGWMVKPFHPIRIIELIRQMTLG
jgi:two-component system chemotaxis response regulator CheY